MHLSFISIFLLSCNIIFDHCECNHSSSDQISSSCVMETSSSVLAASANSVKAYNYNWEACLFCQTTDEKLVCPATSSRKDAGSGYKTLELNLRGFAEIGHLPISLSINQLDEGGGIATTLLKRKARWHKLCRDSFNQTKLNRLKRRINVDGEASCSVASPKKRTRSSCASKVAKDIQVCMFCDLGDGELHQATTFGLNDRVRAAALKLNDSKLLAKLSEGDVIAIEMSYHLKCLSALYRRAEAVDSVILGDDINDRMQCSIAFAELIAYIKK